MRNLRLFVYGTLRSGHGNNSILGPNAVKLVDGTIKAKLWMAGGLPMITDTDLADTSRVVGEVWLLEDENRLADVDMLEGHPYWYRRHEIEVTPDDAEAASLLAWAYFMQTPEVAAYNARLIESGDYTKVTTGG